ncbi:MULTISPECIES: SH3 domain-containing C40 family peptidase [unclassified Pyramidobacter]|uniref:SH3 domain-containing C40 family peptidase n=1 Tax=unclassified Pyramidobacter TaxID=2632171 RepID=UPI0013154342|nr:MULTISPECIES: SH3 domain-containing C40 family peptidase [unclassified Pyramidobacter]
MMRFDMLGGVSLLLALLAAPAAARPALNLTGERIADLDELSQVPSSYLRGALNVRWLDGKKQHELAAAAMAKFFAPWRGGAVDDPLVSGWGFDVLDAPRWGENLRPLTEEKKIALRGQAAMDRFPSMDRAAVAVVNTSARALPTGRPALADPAAAGEGFPFDYMQCGAVWAGTPLRVKHADRSGAWYLCESGLFSGWIRAADVALAGRSFMEKYDTGRYGVIVADDTPLRDAKGRTLAVVHAGAIFPAAAERDGMLVLNVPVRTASGTARIAHACAAAGAAQRWPLPMDAAGVGALADRFMGVNYGWGGLFEDRDCSATMHDLFLPFGIGLPHHSSLQAKCGVFVDLTGKSNEEKLKIIRARGVPFRTLVGMKGHVALFVGLSPQGEPAILHNLWGVRLASEDDPDLSGRIVVGRVVVTTLRPGVERRGMVAPGGLLDRVTTLTFLPGFEPAEKGLGDDLQKEKRRL